MMFLQFFVWGAWYATAGNYMRNVGMTEVIYLAYMVSPIGSLVSPFFLGMVADRFFPVQRVLGVMHLLSGIFVFCAPFAAEGNFTSVPLFLILLLFHMLCYMPTVGLATATAFHNLDDKERQFPLVRIFGSIGWIAAGFLVSFVLQGDTTSLPMHVAGVAGILLGMYSFTLPHVPPPSAGKKVSAKDVIGWEVLSQLKSRPLVLFILSLLLISIPLATYYAYVPVFLRTADITDPAFKMTFGQMSEVLFLLLMPWAIKKFGIKRVVIAGMAAWVIRFALFSMGASGAIAWMLILGIALHGICYDFVYIAGQIYLDNMVSKTIRARVQGLFVLVTYGVGQGIGTLAAGWIFNRMVANAANPLPQWQVFWLLTAAFAAGVTLMFVSGARKKEEQASAQPVENPV